MASSSNAMLRLDGYRFARVGEFLERADNTARLLDVKYHVRLPTVADVGGVVDYYQWLAILRVVGARRAYRVLFKGPVQPAHVAELLIVRTEFPRSLAFCYQQITAHLDAIVSQDAEAAAEAKRQAHSLFADLRFGRIDQIIGKRPARIPDRPDPAYRSLGVADRARAICSRRVTTMQMQFHRPRHGLSLRRSRRPDHPGVAPVAGDCRRAGRRRLAGRCGRQAAAACVCRRIRQSPGDAYHRPQGGLDAPQGARACRYLRPAWCPPRPRIVSADVFHLPCTDRTLPRRRSSSWRESSAGPGSELEQLQRLANAIRDRMDCQPGRSCVERSAADAFAAGAGACRRSGTRADRAARALEVPARYVSGYLYSAETSAGVCHAWSEVFLNDLGWVGFDATHRGIRDERYVRIASGRDYRDAAAVRGVYLGGVAEAVEVTRNASQRSATQSQTSSGQSQRQTNS